MSVSTTTEERDERQERMDPMSPKSPKNPRHPTPLAAALLAAGVLLAVAVVAAAGGSAPAAAAASAAPALPAAAAAPAVNAGATTADAGAPAAKPRPASPAAVPAAPASSRAAALAAFGTVRQVLQHPRCQNCHIPGDAPLQFDAGVTHAQNVKRGPQGAGAPGLPCATCHSTSNPPASYGPHAPPGAPNWRLPAPEHKMVFIGLSAGDLCATVKDPKRNGGRDMAALIEHVSHDQLVLWGWDPGAGRAPVAIDHEAFVASFKTWAAGGAPCPPATRSR